MRLQVTSKSLNGKIQPLALTVAICVHEDSRILWNSKVLAYTIPNICRELLEHSRIHCMFQRLDLRLGFREILQEMLTPDIREAVNPICMGLDVIQKRLRNSIVDLIQVNPQLVLSGVPVVLHCLNEPVDNKRIVVNHHHIWIDHIKILSDLVESKSLFLWILVRSCVILNNSCWNLTASSCIWMALKSKVEGLYTRGQRCELLE